MKTIRTGLLAVGLLLLVVWISGCDKIDPPYKKKISITVDTFPHQRNVLIEDYTAHLCSNCPDAAAKLAYLTDTLYKGRVIGIAIHCGTLAKPQASPMNYDFRTTEGTAWDNAFVMSASGLPNGMVNRAIFSGSRQVARTYFATAAAHFIDSLPIASADIKITNNYSGGTLSSQVDVNFVSALTGTYKLCVVYTEDSIHQAQVYPSGPPVTNYNHMHALRGSLNGGIDDLIATDPAKGLAVTKSYNNITLVSDAVPAHCHVVAFVYNTSTLEIIQVQQAKVQ